MKKEFTIENKREYIQGDRFIVECDCRGFHIADSITYDDGSKPRPNQETIDRVKNTCRYLKAFGTLPTGHRDSYTTNGKSVTSLYLPEWG